MLTSSLEAARIADALPAAEVLTGRTLGFFDLLQEGVSRHEAELET